MRSLPEVAERFIRYARVDTTADPVATSVPSSEGQRVLASMLEQELREMGAGDVLLDVNGYLYVHLPSSHGYAGPSIGLLAHLDTSPDAPGQDVSPVVHAPFDGTPIHLSDTVRLDPSERPALLNHIGEHLITSDGTTLLGSDDKAGVAVLMQLVSDILTHDLPRPRLVVCFTVDEEIGRGIDNLDINSFRADAAYTIDGSGIDTVQSETFNAASVTFDIIGKGVHPGYAKDIMVNALHAAAALITRIPPDERPETTSGRDGFFHVHHVEQGDVSRIGMKWILRDFEAAGLRRRIDLVNEWVTEVQSEFRGLQIGVAIHHEYSNMREAIVSSDARVLSFAHEAARRLGMHLADIPVRGGTDGARLSAIGIPTPNLFNGGYDYHSVYEWNTVENLERSLAYVRSLVQTWSELDSDTTR